MKKIMKELDQKSLEVYVRVKSLIANQRGAVGKDEILGIAAALVVAAFVVIPQLRTFAGTVMTGLTNWWTNTIATKIFPTT